MLKVLVACASGAGTSLMMKDKVSKALKEVGIENFDLSHCDLKSCQMEDYDLIFCPFNFLNHFSHASEKGIKVIGIKNILSEEEFKEKLETSGYVEELKNK